MILLESNELLEHVTSIIHRDTQQQEFHIDLTIDSISRYTEAGSLDFGGSEFHEAGTELLTPEKQQPGDDYGWWKLEPGSYRVRFNEQVDHLEDALIAITPHSHARKAGIVTGTQLISTDTMPDHLELNITVPSHGCNIKENARFASLYIITK